MELRLDPKAYLPGPPDDVDVADWGIGLIGCGGIPNGAHLPAFKKAGYKVVACCDVQEEAARRTAERWGIPFWTTDVRALLDRPDVKIIDLPLHPPRRLEVLQLIAQSPRPVLSQKPLHLELSAARELVETAERARIKLAVNQQARWAPAHRALRVLLDRGAIGDLYSLHHVIRGNQDDPNFWFTKVPNATIADHGVHYLDLARYFAASPRAGAREWTRLSCTTAMVGGQHAIDPMIYSINVEFGEAGGRAPLMGSLQFNNILRARRAHSAIWRLDGTEGSLWVEGNTLCLTRADDPDRVIDYQLKGAWFPDAFMGPIGDLMSAAAHDRPPAVTPRDNLNTVAMTTAAVKSSREGRTVTRAELMGE
ncbi:MAG TPA: Gfo/Idh/MocA family oxidoreductase [Limnochordia bacterium]|nr:Gfo/Idh/MocA family oxidoreductase [Limnochordia bacterium]